MQQKVIVDLWFLGSETACPYVICRCGRFIYNCAAALRMDKMNMDVS